MFCSFLVKRRLKNFRMTSVLIKMAHVNVGYLKVKMDLLKHWHWHPKVCKKKNQHAFVDMLDNSVPWVTVWHHLVEPCDAKQ